MALNPAPIQEPITGPNGRITQVWVRWFLNLVSQIQSGGGAAVWGTITGTLSSQTDLQSALNAKAALVHTHAASDIVSGTINTARLGSGTADATTYLRGDSTWASVVGTAAWGSITGTLSSQSDLQGELDAKQDDLISGTNIKTINGNSVLGSGDLVVGGAVNKITTQVDFGNLSGGEVDIATVTVPAAWALSTIGFVCSPLATATSDHDPEDYALEGINAYVTNVVDGVGFDVIASSRSFTFGKYNIQVIGV